MNTTIKRWRSFLTVAALLATSATLATPALATPTEPAAPAQAPNAAPQPGTWTWPGKVDKPEVRDALAQPVVAALKAEMERAMNGLRLPQREPPYYMAYTLLDVEQRFVVGQLGSIVQSQIQRARTLHPELRVGSPVLDNSFAGAESGMGMAAFGQSLVLDNEETALRASIWVATDAAYRAATAALEQKATQRAGERELEARPADFAAQPPNQIVLPNPEPLPETAEIERLVRVVSQEFLAFPEVHESVVTVAAWRLHRTLITSDGSLAVTPTQVVEMTIECNTQADDGMPLSHELTLFGALDEASLRKAAQRLGSELTELRRAPLAPDYYGPVLFSGTAAPQIVQELLANSVVGTPVPSEGPWARRLQRRVLPANVNLVDDPTAERLQNQPLLGSYVVDDEGVAAQKVTLVERGQLRSLLMSRTPSRDFQTSNGHGRAGYASWPRGVASNLILSTTSPTPLSTQRRQLAKGLPVALEIERLEPREFATNGGAPPAVERAFLITPDGKRTLVRGVTLSEMQVRDLKDVISVGSEPTVNHVLQSAGGYSIPTSFVSPALLFEEVEVKKPKESPALPKFLPRR